MVEGYAGGIQPWWHFISAYHEDRRQYRTPESLLRWHEANEQYLLNRAPVATVGVVWSQENIDFYGRDEGQERVMLPYNGIVQALIRARIPYLPLHVDHIARDGSQFKTLILPNLAAVSDAQVQSLRDFVAQGGNLVVTGESTLYTEWGERRPDFALGDLLGIEATGDVEGSMGQGAANWESYAHHSYLRLHPEQRATVDGPHIEDEPLEAGERHAVLRGFGETDILPFGGRLEMVEPAWDTEIPLTWIPPFPIYPPEFAWMRSEDSGYPALTLRETKSGGRLAYLAADLDRCYGHYHLPDHGDLLANLVRWSINEEIPLYVEGTGLIDCHLYRQSGRLILHLVNLTGSSQAPLEQYAAVGPLQITLQLPADVTGAEAHLLVAGHTVTTAVENGWVQCTVPTIQDHEVLVVS
ncbi:MAG: beta-galactosidase trimerization domain-containing protein [Caldilineaceae bacterium]